MNTTSFTWPLTAVYLCITELIEKLKKQTEDGNEDSGDAVPGSYHEQQEDGSDHEQEGD